MSPFKPFLSPRYPFAWTQELDSAFKESKEAIISAIYTGVVIFDVTKRTCLRPDLSRQGAGYYLSQKHCHCESNIPDCCEDGWKVILVGSRFLHGPEMRYAPIEGEALAVAWGLEQTKYFTEGCDNLLVITDHKPLVKVLGDRTLDEIHNTRLFRLKQRTLPWRFDIIHMPGKSNTAADATSRHPCSSLSTEVTGLNFSTMNDRAEHVLHTAIAYETADLTSISWEDITHETSLDPVLSLLVKKLTGGFPFYHNSIEISLRPFCKIHDSFHVSDQVVIMYGDRVIIPTSLRSRVLQILHSAHQGSTGMEARAQSLLYWPGMSLDIKRTR